MPDHKNAPQHESVFEILENKSKKRKFPEFLNNLVEISKVIPEARIVEDDERLRIKKPKLDESKSNMSVNQSLTNHPAFTKMQIQNMVAQTQCVNRVGPNLNQQDRF